MSARRFRVHSEGFSIPWEMIEAHEPQAIANHDQTLACLNDRGGLSPIELIATLDGKSLREALSLMTENAAFAEVKRRLAAFEDNELRKQITTLETRAVAAEKALAEARQRIEALDGLIKRALKVWLPGSNFAASAAREALERTLCDSRLQGHEFVGGRCHHCGREIGK